MLVAALAAASAPAQAQSCRAAFADSLALRDLRAIERAAAVAPVWDDYTLAQHPLLLVADSAQRGSAGTPVCAAIWRAGAPLQVIELAARPRFSTPLYGMISLDSVGPAAHAQDMAAALPPVLAADAARLRERGVTRAVVLNLPLVFDRLGRFGEMMTSMGVDPAFIQADLAVHESYHLHVQFPAWLDQPRTYAWPTWDRQPDRKQLRERCYAGSPTIAAALEQEMAALLAAFDAVSADTAHRDLAAGRHHARRFVELRATRRALQDTMTVALGSETITCALAETMMELEEGTAQWVGHATVAAAGITTRARLRASYGSPQAEHFYRTGPLQLWVLDGLLGRAALRSVTAALARSTGPDGPNGGVFALFDHRTRLLADTQQSRWPRSTPEAEGLEAAPLSALMDRMRAGDYGNVDRFVVVKNGKLVVSERFARDYGEISRGKLSALGCGIDACTDSAELHEFNYLHPSWHPYYQGRDVHTLQSVTKSIAATLVGVAIGRGEIKGVDEPLLSFFDGYDVSSVDARLHKATLADLLTMRSGIEWHEIDRPLDETNTTLQLERSADWIAFTLSQPMDAAPGEKWVYNSGGSALMAEIIRKATGLHAHAYAEKNLFGPLGIRDYHWKKTPTGHPDTEGGLYLEAEDLARIGQLYLDDGVWNGRRILPAGWAREATTRHVANTNPANPNTPGYGYQWWRYDRPGVEVWAGNGFGGQFIIIVPAHDIVAVVNSWNVFGVQTQGVLRPMIDAVLEAAR